MTTHNYPMEETAAMREFYGGKRCVVTLWDDGLWAHMLDTALASSNPQLRWMLQRNIRQDRYSSHAEVRENIVPQHSSIDLHPPRACLFLHEDVVAKTLQFERELKQWRLSEVHAGRGDPGRPAYEYVFLVQGISPQTPHRWHASVLYPVTVRNAVLFLEPQCPGIDPPHPNPFPVMNTMLSIPFSLMFNLPRLAGLITRNPFRLKLVKMAAEVLFLWACDPLIPPNTPITVGNTQRSPMPRPIYDASRNATFATMRPCTAPISVEPSASSGSRCVVQVDTGAYVVGTTSQVWLQNGALTTVPPDHDASAVREKESIYHTATHVTATSSLNRSVSLCGSMESTPDSAWDDSNDELELKLDVVSLRARVTAWLEDLDKEAMDLSPSDVNDTDPFTPGCIGGMTANDVLMVKGFIDPSVYIHFFDLSLHA